MHPAYFVLYLGKRVDHVFQETARILAVTAITMFLKAIARQWKLSEKNAGKAVDFARYVEFGFRSLLLKELLSKY